MVVEIILENCVMFSAQANIPGTREDAKLTVS